MLRYEYMDPNLPTNQPTGQALTTTVPVSDQPLTLDPNQMPVVPPSGVAVQVPAPPVTPVPVVGGVHKERAPFSQAPVAEYMRPSEVAPQIPTEVAEAGVEVKENKELPQLDSSHKAAGIEHASGAIPVVIPQTTSIYLPYSPAQAKKVEKESSTGDSRHWLAYLTEYIIRKFQAFSN